MTQKEQIEFAEILLTKATPWRKAVFANNEGSAEFGIFFEGTTPDIACAVSLTRDANGKAVHGEAAQLPTREGLEWFRQMVQPLL